MPISALGVLVTSILYALGVGYGTITRCACRRPVLKLLKLWFVLRGFTILRRFIFKTESLQAKRLWILFFLAICALCWDVTLV